MTSSANQLSSTGSTKGAAVTASGLPYATTVSSVPVSLHILYELPNHFFSFSSFSLFFFC
ncbi:predicted protein [Plenodomus lingam JN3]|uniref:Predicted protein n=1 Tax=Leptosphaeria maculans (strain JN3 / isolate v23.1.3 / race Av1-4-5-6-7-8) TaxID=985895 RepID=E4ZH97_LEPMJ|nr:predicted protein [Plenodomus lingam JN3]CBX90667.1 predicted protein [Plenodomus lingam JN3]